MSDAKLLGTVLRKKITNLGLWDEHRVDELVTRIEKDEDAMLKMIGRIELEAARGGSGVQQGIRAMVNSGAVKESLATFEKLMAHELSDESFPRS